MKSLQEEITLFTSKEKNFNLTFIENGEIYSWGYNAHGQLGQGDFNNRNSPELVKSLQGKNIFDENGQCKMGTDYYHSFILVFN